MLARYRQVHVYACDVVNYTCTYMQLCVYGLVKYRINANCDHTMNFAPDVTRY